MAIFTSFWLYDLLIALLAVFAAVYYYFLKTFQHFTDNGIPIPFSPSFPSGHFAGVGRKKSMTIILDDLYKLSAKERFFGCFFFTRCFFVPKDLELIRSILVKDFNNFHDRGFNINIEKDPLGDHLFMLKGQEWRNLRAKMTPTFTSGKIKMMFPTLIEVGKEMDNIFKRSVDDEEIDVKEIFARYTTDVISSVAFGIETNSLKNPDAEFRKTFLELAKPGLIQSMKMVFLFAFPELFNKLPISFVPKHITKFFVDAVRDTMQFRANNDIQRKDFLQLLMQLRNQGFVPDVDAPVDEKERKGQEFTMERAAAQAFIFFVAGFETSSSTMQFTLYELALNPPLQKEVQQDIDQALGRYNNEITYEAVQEMELLDRVVSETLRKYPIAGTLMRECNTDYPIKDSDVVLKSGEIVMLPVYSIHHDPEYYPNPEMFDPNRFLPEVKESRPPFSYMPFGDGPRSCIGNRFALSQVKAGLVIVLSKYQVSPSKNTPIPMVFDPAVDLLSSKNKMNLNINLREK